MIYGQVKADPYAGRSYCFLNPECEILEAETGPSVHSGRVVPIYRKLADLRTRALRQILYQAVSGLPVEMNDPVPPYLRAQLRLLPRARALKLIHFPELSGTKAEERLRQLDELNQGLSPAHKRMIFEELFQFQDGIGMVREKRIRLMKGHKITLGENIRQAIKKILPLYVDRGWRVVRLDVAMPPNRFGPFVARAAYVVELPVGAIETTGTRVGDQLVLRT